MGNKSSKKKTNASTNPSGRVPVPSAANDHTLQGSRSTTNGKEVGVHYRRHDYEQQQDVRPKQRAPPPRPPPVVNLDAQRRRGIQQFFKDVPFFTVPPNTPHIFEMGAGWPTSRNELQSVPPKERIATNNTVPDAGFHGPALLHREDIEEEHTRSMAGHLYERVTSVGCDRNNQMTPETGLLSNNLTFRDEDQLSLKEASREEVWNSNEWVLVTAAENAELSAELEPESTAGSDHGDRLHSDSNEVSIRGITNNQMTTETGLPSNYLSRDEVQQVSAEVPTEMEPKRLKDSNDLKINNDPSPKIECQEIGLLTEASERNNILNETGVTDNEVFCLECGRLTNNCDETNTVGAYENAAISLKEFSELDSGREPSKVDLGRLPSSTRKGFGKGGSHESNAMERSALSLKPDIKHSPLCSDLLCEMCPPTSETLTDMTMTSDCCTEPEPFEPFVQSPVIETSRQLELEQVRDTTAVLNADTRERVDTLQGMTRNTPRCGNNVTSSNNLTLTDDGNAERQLVSLTFSHGIRTSKVRPFIDYLAGDKFKYELKHPIIPSEDQGQTVVKEVIIEVLKRAQAAKFASMVTGKWEGVQVRAKLLRTSDRKAVEDFLQMQCQTSDRKIKQSLEQHQQKIDEMKAVISATCGGVFHSLIEFGRNQERVQALEEKLRELIQQKREFISSTDRLMGRLMGISYRSQMKDQAAAIRRLIDLEIAKLSTALPIYARRTEIVNTVENHQVCVILGETGSGKSTQLVQYIYGAGYATTGKIVCTQPRKVAATSLAKYVARELASTVGKLVGYKLGNSKMSDSSTQMLFVTDHTLLNECIQDPLLKKYSCVIIDEAHERTIYTDLLIGMIKRCLAERPDLKLIITSATIDPQIFINYFDGCPLVRVSGQMFPVEVMYIPVTENKKSFVEDAVTMAVEVHTTQADGDILVFLTSLVDIEKACNMIRFRIPVQNIQVLQLHGRLLPAEQQLVFEPAKRGLRKIIFATNIAETSLTILGVKYVIDTGLAKEKIYDGARNRSSLEVRNISKSSANQRKGRAGRVESGICYRLYSEAQYDSMDLVSTPEIFRVHLGQALMKLMELGVRDTLSFEFVQAPPKEAFFTAMTQLEKLGAAEHGQLTDLGKKMANFPLEPRLAKFVLEAADLGIPYAGIVVAALCTLAGNLFFRAGSEEEKSNADRLKVRFCDQQGDILTMLFAFKEWNLVEERKKSEWCMQNSFNAKSMRLVRETVKEIKGILIGELGITGGNKFEDEVRIRDTVPKLLVRCFCDSLALFSGYDQAGYFLCEKNMDDITLTSVKIHPSSACRFLGQNPEWVVFSQVLTTSESFILNVTNIQEDWIEELILQGIIDLDIRLLKQYLLRVELTDRLGKITGQRLAGKRFCKLKELQIELRKEAAMPFIYLDLDLDIGRIQLVCGNTYTKSVLAILKERIDAEKTILGSHLEECCLVPSSRVRLVLGSGAELTHVLMPSDFCTTVLSNVPVELSKDDILLQCGQVGTVVNCFQFKSWESEKSFQLRNSHDPQKNNVKWGKVTFSDPACAKLATEDENLFPFVVKPAIAFQQKYPPNSLQVKVEWCRRAPKGIAFVGFVDDEDAESARSRIHSLKIGQSTVNARPGRMGKEIFLRNIPQAVTGDLIKEAIVDIMGEVQFEKVAIPRHAELTMPNDVVDLHRQLSGLIKQNCVSDFSVRVLQPKDKEAYFRSYVSFYDVVEGMQVVEDMNGEATIRNQLISMTPMIQTSIFVRREIHDVTEKRLQGVIDSLQSSKGVTIRTTKQRNNDWLFHVDSNNMGNAAYAVGQLQEVIRGVIIDISSRKALRQLLQLSATKWLHSLQKETGTLIQLDRRQSLVTIYGEQEQQTTVEKQIKDYLEERSGQETRSIPLKGEGLPVGMMKQLFVKYGIHLTKLQAQTKASYVEVDVRKHVLHVSGDIESLECIEQEINELQQCVEKSLDGNTTGENACIGDCPICLCPVARNDCYILECCGHPNCSACIVSLVESAVQNRDFPIQCAAEGCQQRLFMCDFQEILQLSKLTWQELHGASLDSFVGKHKDLYKYCITPNCPMVYRQGTDGTVFTCDACHVNICTACHVQYHHGITCQMYQMCEGIGKSDPVLTKWLMKDLKNRSLCPKCEAPIEKNGGCQKITCTNCRTEMCWRCKKTFTSEADAYTHLRIEHGGFA